MESLTIDTPHELQMPWGLHAGASNTAVTQPKVATFNNNSNNSNSRLDLLDNGSGRKEVSTCMPCSVISRAVVTQSFSSIAGLHCQGLRQYCCFQMDCLKGMKGWRQPLKLAAACQPSPNLQPYKYWPLPVYPWSTHLGSNTQHNININMPSSSSLLSKATRRWTAGSDQAAASLLGSVHPSLATPQAALCSPG